MRNVLNVKCHDYRERKCDGLKTLRHLTCHHGTQLSTQVHTITLSVIQEVSLWAEYQLLLLYKTGTKKISGKNLTAKKTVPAKITFAFTQMS